MIPSQQHTAALSRGHSLSFAVFSASSAAFPSPPPQLHRRCRSDGEPRWRASLPLSDVLLPEGMVQPKDVVLGTRGIRDSALAFPGNRRFHVLIAMRLDRYREAASQRDKSAIAVEVERAVRESGGRFLRYERGQLVDVDDRGARDKIARAFRVALRRAKPPQTSHSGGASLCAVCGDVETTRRRHSSVTFAPLSWQRKQRASEIYREQVELADFLQNTFLLEAGR